MIRTAQVYRTKARALKMSINPEQYGHKYGEPDEVQFEIAVFSDGRVAQRWLVGKGSSVWWDSLEDLYAVHVDHHDGYGTEIHWSDGIVEKLS